LQDVFGYRSGFYTTLEESQELPVSFNQPGHRLG
jgi:hypothetical protein